MSSVFGQILDAAMRKAGFSQLAFAQGVGVNQGFLSRVIAGERTPPLDAIPTWVDALDLEPEAAEELTRQAYLAHCPEWVQSYVAELELRLRVAEASIAYRVTEGPRHRP